MNTFILYCIPFFAAAVFHLISCLAGKKRYADISKVILMPLLTAAVAFYAVRFKAGSASALRESILAALICTALTAGMFGDIFLLGEVKPATMAKGLSSFLAGHLIYIGSLAFFTPFYPPAPLFTAALIGVYAAVVYASRFLSGKPKGAIGFAVMLYAVILASFSAFALLKLAGVVMSGQAQTLIVPLLKIYAGTLLFLASDSILARTIFFKPFFQSRFIVMATYISAQFFIAWGFCSTF